MNVVIRGIMAAALGVYASIHLTQAISGPDASAGWLTVAFALTGAAAIALAVALVLVPEDQQKVVDAAAALLVGGSLVALVLSWTVGLFGVTEEALRVETLLVVVAEVVALGAYALSLRFGGNADLLEVDTTADREARRMSERHA